MKEINNPTTGVFIFSKKVENKGSIISEGIRPITHIQTDKYSGSGIVQSKENKLIIEKWYQKWWGQLFIGLIVTIIGGLILWLITKK